MVEIQTAAIEFRQLVGSDADALDPQGLKWPEGTLVIFALEDSEVVGRSAAIAFPMIEGTWVADRKQNSTLAYRLVREVEKVQRELGNAYMFAFAHDDHPKVSEYLLRVGYEKAPLTIYSKKLTDEG